MLCVLVSAQIPEGGALLIEEAINNHLFIGSQYASLKTVDIENQEFSKALELKVKSQPNNNWSVQIKFSSKEDVQSGDVILLAFYGRVTESGQETGEGFLKAVFENNDDYQKTLYQDVNLSNSWKQYYIPFISDQTLSKTESNFAFHAGYPPQTIQVADIKWLNYRNTLTLDDLPETEYTYIGREEDAPWRAEAKDRINKYRKGKIIIQVTNENGEPEQGATVNLKMKRHHFGFGSAIDAKVYHSNETYRNKILELFNEIVFENDLKWNTWYYNNDHSYISEAMDELETEGIRMRGHVLVWPSFKYNPAYVKDLENSPGELRAEILKYFDERVEFAYDRLVDWDVINEPFNNHEFMDILGKNEMVTWFQRLENLDPNANRYINDFSILSGGGFNNAHQDHYYNTINYIDENGGSVQGIGMQGHFSYDLTAVPRLISILDRFAGLNKEIKITEFDVNITNRELQADYTRDFMTAVFSHPSVKSILTWGFWEGKHWRPDAALYDQSWNLRPHGEVWHDLVFNKWWTDVDTLTDSNGSACIEGFLGEYELTVSDGTITRTENVYIDSRFETIIQMSMDPDKDIIITGKNHNTAPPRISVFPNPVQENINIDIYPRKAGKYFYQIYDLSGNIISYEELPNNQILKLNNKLDDGIYFLRILNKYTSKTIKFCVL